MSLGYRDRIYACYASKIQNSGLEFDVESAKRWSAPYRNKYLRNWLPQDRAAPVLEVACGGGRLLYLMKSLGYSDISGVDLSMEQVMLSRQVLSHDQVHLDEVISFLEQRPGKYGLIIGLDLIEHFQKDECLRFLDACHRSLVPGGRVVLQTPNLGCPWGGDSRYGDFTHEIGFTPGSLLKILNVVGFLNLEARELGPYPRGIASSIRWVLWAGLRRLLMLWNLIEIGSVGSGVFTRNFIASGQRPPA